MITGNKVRLRKKKIADTRNDFLWQSSAELAKLDAAPVYASSYSQYVIDYAREMRFPVPERRVFAVETLDGRHIGNCVYYHIDSVKGEAEVGIMIGDRDYWGKGYGTDTINTLVDHLFSETKLNRLYLKTLEWNERAQRCFARCGFIPCGRSDRGGYDFKLMDLTRERWAERKQADTKDK